MSDPELTVTQNNAAQRFEVRLGDDVAFADYRLEPGTIVFPHTVVPPAFGGKGIGGKLVEAGLAYAGDHNLSVKPTCEFFHAYISKRPELHSLVHAEMRVGLVARKG